MHASQKCCFSAPATSRLNASCSQRSTPSKAWKMQKILRRTQMAVKQADKRRARKQALIERDQLAANWRQEGATRRYAIKDIKKHRFERKEDWQLGPLAPRRDVGNFKDTYGTISGNQMEGYEFLADKEKTKRLAPWGGHAKNIKKDDRVVILSGHDKGKIGKVVEVDEKKLEARIEGLNKFDFEVPDFYFIGVDEDRRVPTQSIEKPVSLADLRLVVALETQGKTQDVLVKEMYSKFSGGVSGGKFRHGMKRFIGGTEVEIPWPEVEEEEKVFHRGIDTPRKRVLEKTFVPTLNSPPMPESVIDELRNKYSKFRTRHTKEYIAEREAEDEEKRQRLESVKLMRKLKGPKGDKKKKKKKNGTMEVEGEEGELTDKMLERIGMVIAKNKGLVIEQAEEQKMTGAPASEGASVPASTTRKRGKDAPSTGSADAAPKGGDDAAPAAGGAAASTGSGDVAPQASDNAAPAASGAAASKGSDAASPPPSPAAGGAAASTGSDPAASPPSEPPAPSSTPASAPSSTTASAPSSNPSSSSTPSSTQQKPSSTPPSPQELSPQEKRAKANAKQAKERALKMLRKKKQQGDSKNKDKPPVRSEN